MSTLKLTDSVIGLKGIELPEIEVNLGEEDFPGEYNPEVITRDKIHLIIICDDSVSMSRYGSCAQVNNAIPKAIRAAIEGAKKHNAELDVRLVVFGSHAYYAIGSVENGVSGEQALESFKPLTGNSGNTNTAEAIDAIIPVMSSKILGTHAYNPIVLLLSDGGSNNPEETNAKSAELASCMVNDTMVRTAIRLEKCRISELEAFASKGTIISSDGEAKENVPLVFPVKDINNLDNILESIVKSSIASVTKVNNNAKNNVVINI